MQQGEGVNQSTALGLYVSTKRLFISYAFNMMAASVHHPHLGFFFVNHHLLQHQCWIADDVGTTISLKQIINLLQGDAVLLCNIFSDGKQYNTAKAFYIKLKGMYSVHCSFRCSPISIFCHKQNNKVSYVSLIMDMHILHCTLLWPIFPLKQHFYISPRIFHSQRLTLLCSPSHYWVLSNWRLVNKNQIFVGIVFTNKPCIMQVKITTFGK